MNLERNFSIKQRLFWKRKKIKGNVRKQNTQKAGFTEGVNRQATVNPVSRKTYRKHCLHPPRFAAAIRSFSIHGLKNIV